MCWPVLTNCCSCQWQAKGAVAIVLLVFNCLDRRLCLLNAIGHDYQRRLVHQPCWLGWCGHPWVTGWLESHDSNNVPAENYFSKHNEDWSTCWGS
jgi:hypothetical protein